MTWDLINSLVGGILYIAKEHCEILPLQILHAFKNPSQNNLFIWQVIANVFFDGNLSSVFHIVVTVIVITVAMLVSLLIDCLGIVLELNVSTFQDLPLHS